MILDCCNFTLTQNKNCDNFNFINLIQNRSLNGSDTNFDAGILKLSIQLRFLNRVLMFKGLPRFPMQFLQVNFHTLCKVFKQNNHITFIMSSLQHIKHNKILIFIIKITTFE